MDPRFIQCDRDTLYLMPPSVQDRLPENHLARFVVDIVSQLDLWPLVSAYAGRGSDAYPPGTLLALLFYGYATGFFQVVNWKRQPMILWLSVLLQQILILIMTPLPLSASASLRS